MGWQGVMPTCACIASICQLCWPFLSDEVTLTPGGHWLLTGHHLQKVLERVPGQVCRQSSDLSGAGSRSTPCPVPTVCPILLLRGLSEHLLFVIQY